MEFVSDFGKYVTSSISNEEKEALKEYGEALYKIDSPITLTSEEGLYNKVYVVERNGKIYVYNEYGEKVFLPEEGISKESYYNDISFEKVDGELVLCVKYQGDVKQKNIGKLSLTMEKMFAIYYTEDGKEYKPLGPIEKIKQMDTILKPYIEELHSVRIEQQPRMEEINRKIDTVLRPLGEKILNKLSPLANEFYNLLHTELVFTPKSTIKTTQRPKNDGIRNKDKEHSREVIQ